MIAHPLAIWGKQPLTWCGCFLLHMLTGAELIALVKANPEMNRTQLAKTAGYVQTKEDGKKKVLVQKFYDALLEAQGLAIKNGHPGIGNGKTAQHLTTVHKSGILLVGKSYTKEFGAEPGDVFGIEVREDGIWLPLKERDLELRKEAAECAVTAAAEKVAVAA